MLIAVAIPALNQSKNNYDVCYSSALAPHEPSSPAQILIHLLSHSDTPALSLCSISVLMNACPVKLYHITRDITISKCEETGNPTSVISRQFLTEINRLSEFQTDKNRRPRN